ncbi:hypothetical protein CN887_21320 [Bacillus pseudomycoides]|uniref:geobacillin-26 family protein n=1 Tax=Bacillus pseudomycoides TaxID=64104 RepID=UPI000BF06020|nr:geobacillin-26 family protein [Bacillus pseudomycoides]PEJ23248.1 hypothetical protein CN887_21320 [Bacillus pseudomycoides]
MSLKRNAKYLSLGLALTVLGTTLVPNSSAAQVDLNTMKMNNEQNEQAMPTGVTTTRILNQQDVKSRVIEDSAEKRVVEAWDNEGKYRATFYKKSNEVITETLDDMGRPLTSTSTKENRLPKDNIQYSQQRLELVDSGKDWLGKYKYYFYTQNVWIVQIPGRSKNPIQSANNKTDLGAFRTAVNNLRVEQIVLAKAAGTTVATSAVAVATSASGWGTVLAGLKALDASTDMIIAGEKVNNLTKDCHYNFQQISLN